MKTSIKDFSTTFPFFVWNFLSHIFQDGCQIKASLVVINLWLSVMNNHWRSFLSFCVMIFYLMLDEDGNLIPSNFPFIMLDISGKSDGGIWVQESELYASSRPSVPETHCHQTYSSGFSTRRITEKLYSVNILTIVSHSTFRLKPRIIL